MTNFLANLQNSINAGVINREIEFEFGFSQLPSNQGDLPISAINTLANYEKQHDKDGRLNIGKKTSIHE